MGDVFTQMICTQYFLKKQGCEIRGNVIYQDNQSAIKLENNGRRSSSKQKRHINTRCYFIADRITKQEGPVDLCPNLDITVDYFTKEIQVSQFRCFRSIIIGIHEDDITPYNASRRSFL